MEYGNLAFFLKSSFFPIVKTTSEGKRGFRSLLMTFLLLTIYLEDEQVQTVYVNYT